MILASDLLLSASGTGLLEAPRAPLVVPARPAAGVQQEHGFGSGTPSYIYGPPLAESLPESAKALVGSPIWRVLERARWAPTGDNAQTWRFRLVSPTEGEVLAFDNRQFVIYDIDGTTCQLAFGALLENIRLAASAIAHRAEVATDLSDERHIRFRVRLVADASVRPDPLERSIEVRAVHRRPLATTPISADQRAALQADAAACGASVRFYDSFAERLRLARLLYVNAGVRLFCPELHHVHRDIMDWDHALSPDRLPVESLGVDPVTQRLMRWALQDWRRVSFLYSYLMGSVLPRIQLDVIPALRCGAHVAVLMDQAPRRPADHIEAGRAVQRLWLRMTALGLQMQPEYTPICFSAYVRQDRRFTAVDAVWAAAKRLNASWESLLGGRPAAERVVWLGRVGHGQPAASRSVRLPFPRLLVP